MNKTKQAFINVTYICILNAALAGCGAVHPLLKGAGPKTNFESDNRKSEAVIEQFNAFVSTLNPNRPPGQQAGEKLLEAYFGKTLNNAFPELIIAYSSKDKPPAVALNYKNKPVRALANEPNLWVLIFSSFSLNNNYQTFQDTAAYFAFEGLAYEQGGGISDIIASLLTQKPTGNLFSSQQTNPVYESSLEAYPNPTSFKGHAGENSLYLYRYKINLERNSVYRINVLPKRLDTIGYEFHFANLNLSPFGFSIGVGAVNGTDLSGYLFGHWYVSQQIARIFWASQDDWKWHRWLAVVIGTNLQHPSSDILGTRFTPFTNEWKDNAAGRLGIIAGWTYDWANPLSRWPLFFGVDYKL